MGMSEPTIFELTNFEDNTVVQTTVLLFSGDSKTFMLAGSDVNTMSEQHIKDCFSQQDIEWTDVKAFQLQDFSGNNCAYSRIMPKEGTTISIGIKFRRTFEW